MYSKLLILSFIVAPALSAGSCDNVEIKSSGDLSQANSCTKIGSLSITGEELSEVVLSNLQSVENDINVSATSTLTKLSMPKLTSSKNLQINNNSGLSSVAIPALTKLMGYLFVSGNSPKLQFSASKLDTIGGNATFSNCSAIDVSSLEMVNNMLSFSGNSASNISLPVLKTVASSVSFSSNDQISSLALPKLESVSGALLIANNTNLETVTLSNLATVGGALEVSGKVSKLDVPALQEVKGGASIQSDSKSSLCKEVTIEAAVSGKFECKDGTSESKTSKNGTSGSANKTKSGNNSSDAVSSQLLTNSISAILIGSSMLAFMH